MNNQSILQQLDPELVQHITSRREVVANAAKLIAGIASVPIALGVLANTAFGKDLPQQIVDVLNFALTLEHIEDDFYRGALSHSGLIPKSDHEVFDTIGKHESAHVKALSAVLGSKAGPAPNVDPTAGGMFADVFSNYQTFLALSETFEDTGVRAYKGQAGNLMSNGKILTTALTIHSVEARHASEVRRLRGDKGWITGDSRGTLPAASQPTYDGEQNTVQGGIDLSSISGVPPSALTEAFDEPLTKEQVLAIVKPFLKQ